MARDREAAESAIVSAMNIDTELVKNNPSGNEFRKMQALRFEDAGELFQKLQEPSKALHFYQECSTTFSRMQSKDPADAGLRLYLAACYNGMGATLAKLHRPNEAEVFHKKALNLVQPNTTTNLSNEETLYRIADSYAGLGKDEAVLAAEPGQTKLMQIEHWESSRTYYGRSLRVWGQVKRPRHTSPEGIACIGPAVVAQLLETANNALRRINVKNGKKPGASCNQR
jgi:tetratricopeptide (TPR) repeat protein